MCAPASSSACLAGVVAWHVASCSFLPTFHQPSTRPTPPAVRRLCDLQVNQLLAEASQRIQPNVGELFPALKVRPRYSRQGRLADGGTQDAPCCSTGSSCRCSLQHALSSRVVADL